MSRCNYIFIKEDRSVTDGKKIVGDRCKSKLASVDTGGYCMGHAIKMKAISPEYEKEILSRRMASAAEGRQMRRQRRATVARELVETCKTGEDGRLKVNPRVLAAMGLDQQCDLAYEYSVFKALNMNPSVSCYDEKMAFARWLETPEHLRIPETMEEAAAVLGMSIRALIMWKTSPDIINFINQDVESRIGGLYKMCIYGLGEGVDRGDKGCMEILLKHLKEKQESSKNKRKGFEIPKEMQKEADEYAKLNDHEMQGVALKSTKEAINGKYFSETLEKKEEIPQ